uniref:BHLH domain-containing protein n=1 Tax=Rhabditophanes sp. KR3021 TaxID=114890 RepID=A0AC35TI75_9BILA
MDDQGNKIYQRNERERLRVRWINDGFQSVRNVLPSYLVKTRMSKLETLYLAIAHITHLEKVLEDENHVYSCTCYDNAFK